MAKFDSIIFSSVLMLSLFIFSASLHSSKLMRLRNYQNEYQNFEEEDELGGSLLDSVSPSSSQSRDLFQSNEIIEKLIEKTDINKLIDNINQPIVKKNKTVTSNNVTKSNETRILNKTKIISEIKKISNKLSNSTKVTIKKISNKLNATKNIAPLNSISVKPVNIISSKRVTSNKTVPISETPHINQTTNTPYSITENRDMKYLSILTIVIFGCSFMTLKLAFSLFKSKKESFFSQGIKKLSNGMLLYFLSLNALFIVYSYGLLKFIKINLEFLIAAFSIFGFSWLFFSIIILALSSLAINKWKYLESSSRDSFSNCLIILGNIKIKYENLADKPFKQNFSKSEVFELYEYLTLKLYFCVPFNPVFKASTLKKEFKFYIYLSFCLLRKLSLFFKFSWTALIISVSSISLLRLFMSENILKITVVLPLFPLCGLFECLLLYSYMKKVYRNVVKEVNKNNYLSFTDIEFNQNFALKNFIEYPVYLNEALENKEDSIRTNIFHQLFHKRMPTLYEEKVVFGATGFSLILNLLQSAGLSFVLWSTLFYLKYFGFIVSHYGRIAYAVVIPVFLLYLFLYSYLISISLRWYTVISSIETKRDEKSLKRTIEYQMNLASVYSDRIFNIFKRLYFDIRINKKDYVNFNLLETTTCQNILEINYRRFKGIKDKLSIKAMGEKYAISLESELKSFLLSLGVKADVTDVEFILHLIENYSEKEDDITLEQLFEIWGAQMHFSSQYPEEILNYVLDDYFKRREDLEPVLKRDSSEMDLIKLDHFVDSYKEYFTSELVEFLMEETVYLGKSFSRDAFIQMVIAPRRYHPY